MMKRLTLLLTVCLCMSASAAFSQRSVSARTVVLDDGFGNTLTLMTPSPMAGSGTFTLTPGSTGVQSGTLDGQTLRWNNTTTAWEASGALLNLNTATTG